MPLIHNSPPAPGRAPVNALAASRDAAAQRGFAPAADARLRPRRGPAAPGAPNDPHGEAQRLRLLQRKMEDAWRAAVAVQNAPPAQRPRVWQQVRARLVAKWPDLDRAIPRDYDAGFLNEQIAGGQGLFDAQGNFDVPMATGRAEAGRRPAPAAGDAARAEAVAEMKALDAYRVAVGIAGVPEAQRPAAYAYGRRLYLSRYPEDAAGIPESYDPAFVANLLAAGEALFSGGASAAAAAPPGTVQNPLPAPTRDNPAVTPGAVYRIMGDDGAEELYRWDPDTPDPDDPTRAGAFVPLA